MQIKEIKESASNEKEMSNLCLKELKELREIIEKESKNLPEGSLRISYSHGKVQYNLYKKGVLRYIKTSEIDLARKLAQKSYYLALNEALKVEIHNAMCQTKPQKLETVFETMPKAKQLLVKPLVVSDEEFAKKWQSTKYENTLAKPSGFFITDKGESARSKSELIIANKLKEAGIPYHYEKPIRVGEMWICPDFTILIKSTRQEVIWEHFGRMSDSKYRFDCWNKLNQLLKSGYEYGKNVVMTFEEENYPLMMSSVDAIIKTLLSKG